MSLDQRDLLVSISRRGTSISEVADDILNDETLPVDENISKLCALLHMPPTTDAVKIAARVLPRLQHEPENVYEDFINDLEFDEDKAEEFYLHYLDTLRFQNVASSSVYYMFGSPSVFNKSYEENYGCARALQELYGDDDAPDLWRSIQLFRGRILDAD
jgi:hypothetical protein